MIQVSGLAAGYPGKVVLEGIEFSVKAGDFLAVLGPNGSGKSTLLKTLLGTAEVHAGTLTAFGSDLKAISIRERARLLAYVPQSEPTTFPFSVLETVLMARSPRANGFWDHPDDVAAAREALQVADSLDLMDAPITELSGGELQRVWMARALAQDCPGLLLDEPTAHLDAQHVAAFAKLTHRMKTEGKVQIGVFHDLNLALQVATHYVLLDHGKVAFSGPVAEFTREHAETVYRARFQTAAGHWWVDLGLKNDVASS